MKTFQNVSKAELLKELNWHLEQDRIIQGCYGNIGNNFKGCHMGCVANSIARINGVYLKPNDHQAQAEYLYGDKSCEWFVRLCEGIFEGLDVDEAKQWVVDSFAARPEEGIPSESLNTIEIPIKIFILEKTKGFHSNKDVIHATNLVIEALKGNGGMFAADAAWAASAYSYATCSASAYAAYATYDAYAASCAAYTAACASTSCANYAADASASYRFKFYEELAAFVIEQLKGLDTDLRKETELIKGE